MVVSWAKVELSDVAVAETYPPDVVLSSPHPCEVVSHAAAAVAVSALFES